MTDRLLGQRDIPERVRERIEVADDHFVLLDGPPMPERRARWRRRLRSVPALIVAAAIVGLAASDAAEPYAFVQILAFLLMLGLYTAGVLQAKRPLERAYRLEVRRDSLRVRRWVRSLTLEPGPLQLRGAPGETLELTMSGALVARLAMADAPPGWDYPSARWVVAQIAARLGQPVDVEGLDEEGWEAWQAARPAQRLEAFEAIERAGRARFPGYFAVPPEEPPGRVTASRREVGLRSAVPQLALELGALVLRRSLDPYRPRERRVPYTRIVSVRVAVTPYGTMDYEPRQGAVDVLLDDGETAPLLRRQIRRPEDMARLLWVTDELRRLVAEAGGRGATERGSEADVPAALSRLARRRGVAE